jgi:hypothetical protein
MLGPPATAPPARLDVQVTRLRDALSRLFGDACDAGAGHRDDSTTLLSRAPVGRHVHGGSREARWRGGVKRHGHTSVTLGHKDVCLAQIERELLEAEVARLQRSLRVGILPRQQPPASTSAVRDGSDILSMPPLHCTAMLDAVATWRRPPPPPPPPMSDGHTASP